MAAAMAAATAAGGIRFRWTRRLPPLDRRAQGAACVRSLRVNCRGIMDNPVNVRHERAADIDAVRRVNELAFGRAGEADLVDRLRGGDRVISIVATSREGGEGGEG